MQRSRQRDYDRDRRELPEQQDIVREVNRILKGTKMPTNEAAWNVLLDDVLAQTERTFRAHLRSKKRLFNQLIRDYFPQKNSALKQNRGLDAEAKPFRSSLMDNLAKKGSDGNTPKREGAEPKKLGPESNLKASAVAFIPATQRTSESKPAFKSSLQAEITKPKVVQKDTQESSGVAKGMAARSQSDTYQPVSLGRKSSRELQNDRDTYKPPVRKVSREIEDDRGNRPERMEVRKDSGKVQGGHGNRPPQRMETYKPPASREREEIIPQRMETLRKVQGDHDSRPQPMDPKAPLTSSLIASIETKETSSKPLKSEPLVESDEQRKKKASEALKLKFEARRREREQQSKIPAPALAHQDDKDLRVKSFYAKIEQRDLKEAAARQPPKPFKSSLQSSVGSTAAPSKPKCLVSSRPPGSKKVIYTIEELQRLNSRFIPRPTDLPDMTIIVAEPHKAQSNVRHQQQTRGPPPRGGRRTESRDRNKRRDGGGRGRGRGRYDRRRNVPEEPIFDGPVEPLKMSKDRWVPTKKDTGTLEGAIKQVKALLNKMTREHFEKLTSQLLAIKIDSLQILSAVVTSILDKAWAEPNFADVYADLCQILHTKMSTPWKFIRSVESRDDNKFYSITLEIPAEIPSAAGPFRSLEDVFAAVKLGSYSEEPLTEVLSNERLYLWDKKLIYVFKRGTGDQLFCHVRSREDLGKFEPLVGPFATDTEAVSSLAKQTTIKRLLLNSVQEEFNRENRHLELQAADTEYASLSDEVKKRKDAIYLRDAKRLSLGNIRFIGALFKVGMLNEKAVQRCILKLLGLKRVETERGTAAQTIRMPDEEDIEALCKLLTTVGKKVDHEGVRDMMDAVILRIVELSDMKDLLSSRIRFMLKDILEMRDFRWEPRHQELQQKTLEEVRKEAERLQRQGKNAQHDNISAVRRRTKQSSRQLALERSNLLLHGEIKEESVPDEPEQTEVTSEMDSEKCATRIKSIIDEYVSIKDIQEAVQCVKEMPSSAGSQLAEQSINMALEAKEPVRLAIADLIRGLYENGAISATAIESGFQSCLEFLDDIRIDIPLVDQYAGLILGRMVAAGCFGLSYLKRSCQHLTESGLGEKLLVKVLEVVKLESDSDTISTLLSDVKLSDFFASTKRTREYVEEFKVTNEALFCDDEHEDSDEDDIDLDSPRLMNRMKSIIREYLSIQDATEVCACVDELPPASLVKFVSLSITDALERKEEDRIKITIMFDALYENHSIEAEDLQDGIHQHIEFFPDMRVDIPRLETYMAQILAPLLSSGALTLKWIVHECESLVESGIAIRLIHETLALVGRENGREKILNYIRDSKVTKEQLIHANLSADEALVSEITDWFQAACAIDL